ncbi:MAG: hypothetical protein L7U72_16040, partial [Rubripirellula sp.]|nr:hypothetical protein [Rubripirellula sp.]
RQDREKLLRSIIEPSAVIAPGYGLVTILLTDGSTKQGVLIEELEDGLTLQLADGSSQRISRSDVEAQSKPTSIMPDLKSNLTLRQIRDLVAFLKTL